MRHYNIGIDSSQIGRGRDGPGEHMARNEASSTEGVGSGVQNLGCVSAESDGENGAGEQSTIVRNQLFLHPGTLNAMK